MRQKIGDDKWLFLSYAVLMSDFRTLPAGRWQQTYVVQKSRFIAYAMSVKNAQEAQDFLKSVALPDATHHCYAYVTADGQKSSDNGEPAGTAGIPILQAIKQKNLLNVAVAVERYFGGIKLGTGGLARAYGEAATQVLDAVNPILMRECVVLEFKGTYEQQASVSRLVAGFGKELAVQYADLISWQVAIPVNQKETFIQQLAEVQHGVIDVVVKIEQAWVEFLND